MLCKYEVIFFLDVLCCSGKSTRFESGVCFNLLLTKYNFGQLTLCFLGLCFLIYKGKLKMPLLYTQKPKSYFFLTSYYQSSNLLVLVFFKISPFFLSPVSNHFPSGQQFFYCGKIYIIIISLTILSIQFIGIKYIHNIV